MSKQKFFINEDELDDFQIQLLQKRIDQCMVVSGCAGSGKSILALWKAKQIQELSKEGSYLFIVYTKALRKYMLDGIKSIGLESDNFMYHWEWKNKGCPNADYIIVDEVQDFDKSEIEQFKASAKRAFFLWGDSKQSLYNGLNGKRTQPIMEIAQDAGVMAEQLYFNHRLPKKIARLSAEIIDDQELVGKCRREGAHKPKIVQYATFEEQLDAAMEIIGNRDITDAGILLATNDLVGKAYDYLSANGFNVEAKYEDKQNRTNSKFNLNFSSDNPKLLTYHSAKGLQFEAVFMPECSPIVGRDQTPLYVAMTRSYQYLYIMYTGAFPTLFDPIPNELYDRNIEEEDIEL